MISVTVFLPILDKRTKCELQHYCCSVCTTTPRELPISKDIEIERGHERSARS